MKRWIWGMIALMAATGLGFIIAGSMNAPEREAQWRTWNDRTALSLQENETMTENNPHSKQSNSYNADVQAARNYTGTSTSIITDDKAAPSDTSTRISNEAGTQASNGEIAARNQDTVNDAMIDHNDYAAAVGSTTGQNAVRSSTVDEKPATPNDKVSLDGKISINEAGLTELTGLPGIGDKKAQAIIDYRRVHGPFRHVNELDRVKGIGSKMLAKMLPYVKL